MKKTFGAKAPDAAPESPERRLDRGGRPHDTFPLLRGPVVMAEAVAETVRDHGGVRIQRARIEGPLALSLEGLRRAVILADSVEFQGPVAFEAGYDDADTLPDFSGSTFEEDASFADINPIGDLILYDVAFKGSVDFFSTDVLNLNSTRLRAGSPINIRWSQFGRGWLDYSLSWADAGAEQQHRKVYVETGLMFWKNNFARLGYERDEREVRFELIKFRRKHMSLSQVEWWATSLLEIPNGFGTSPYRPLWIGLLAIDLFAVFYWRKNVFVPKDPGNPPAYRPPLLLFSLLYSLDTFLPFLSATDARNQGFEVAPDYRGWELGERILGLVITLLSAYSIGSYVI